MSRSIKIDDATYEAVTKFAQQEDRLLSNALARLVKLGLANVSEGISIEEQTAPVSLAAPTPTPSQVKTVTLDDVKKAMREMEADRKQKKNLALEDLTEKDLATAKVTFEDRPDFKEPEKWDSKAWPTV